MVDCSSPGSSESSGASIGLSNLKLCTTCRMQVISSEFECPHDGTLLVPLFTDEDVEFNQKFEILDVLGVGGMAVVYRARHKQLDRLLAIKMLQPQLTNVEMLQRFQIEGRAASLLRHPFVVNVYDIGVTASGHPYMVMDFVDGKNLDQVLREQGPFSSNRILSLFIQLTEALSSAHKQMILHRDIKPSNIMLCKNDEGEEEIRILDFGIAKLLHDSGPTQLTRSGQAMGSPLYMSPEQARGSNIDQRSDIYSLGCVMYQLLTGVPPFNGASVFEVMLLQVNEKERPVSLSAATGGVIQFDPELERIVAKSLEKARQSRYGSMEELKLDLTLLRDAARNRQGHFVQELRKLGARFSHSSRKSLIVAIIVACLVVPNVLHRLYMQERKSVFNPVVQSMRQPRDMLLFDKSMDVGPVMESTVRKREPVVDVDALRKAYSAFARHIVDADLQPLRNATNAVYLNLHGTNVTDAGLEIIKHLGLRQLNLAATQVHSLAPLKEMKTLQYLNLSDSPVNSAGMAVVAGLTNLEQLDLSVTEITDQDLHYLEGLRKLRGLSLEFCFRVSEEGVRRLTAKLPPDCHVVYIQEEPR